MHIHTLNCFTVNLNHVVLVHKIEEALDDGKYYIKVYTTKDGCEGSWFQAGYDTEEDRNTAHSGLLYAMKLAGV